MYHRILVMIHPQDNGVRDTGRRLLGLRPGLLHGMTYSELSYISLKLSTVEELLTTWDKMLLHVTSSHMPYSFFFDREWYSLYLKLARFFLYIVVPSLCIFVARGVYNRYYHPLRDFPGPFWSSFTDLYKLFVLSCSDVSSLGLELHKRYGES